jgi:hypothetical protein
VVYGAQIKLRCEGWDEARDFIIFLNESRRQWRKSRPGVVVPRFRSGAPGCAISEIEIWGEMEERPTQRILEGDLKQVKEWIRARRQEYCEEVPLHEKIEI